MDEEKWVLELREVTKLSDEFATSAQWNSADVLPFAINIADCLSVREEGIWDKPNLLATQFFLSQILRVLSSRRISHSQLQSYELYFLVNGVCKWITFRQFGKVEMALQVLRNLLGVLRAFSEYEDFCHYFRKKKIQGGDTPEIILIHLLDKDRPVWLNRIVLETLLQILSHRSLCSEELSLDLLTLYIRALQPFFYQSISPMDPQLMSSLLYLFRHVSSREHSILHLELVAHTVTPDIVLFLCTLIASSQPRKLKTSTYLLFANLLAIPSFLANNNTNLTLLLESIEDHLKHKKRTIRAAALLVLSKLVLSPDIADLIVVRKTKILPRVFDILDEDTFKKKLSSKHRIHLQHDGVTTALKLCANARIPTFRLYLSMPLLAKAFSMLPKHRLECPCELCPHVALPAADRILTLFPNLASSTEFDPHLSEGLCTTLEDVSTLLNTGGYYRYARRAKLLSERHFDIMRLYTF